jgi:signal transduction histidine kinase
MVSVSPDVDRKGLADCLAQAISYLHPLQLTVVADENGRFPLSAGSLSVILRNLLANTSAAKAHRVDVFTTNTGGRWSLVVDDDGVGLGAREDGYEHGSGLGLGLCRRIVERSGGRLEIMPRLIGGTRAILSMERAA